MSELALQLTEKCLKNKETYLDLGNCGLRDRDFAAGSLLDIKLRQCIHLTELILSGYWLSSRSLGLFESVNNEGSNYLTVCPPAVDKLNKLHALICCGIYGRRWSISDISFVNALPNLEVLDISCNEITQLKDFENLPRLRVLDVSANKISRLEGLENLNNLEELFIANNSIRKLEGFENLGALKELFLSTNKISKLEGLENLSALERFYIANNSISKLEGLENLRALQELDVSSNQIGKLEGLENLNSLQYLNISFNEIARLEGLDHLNATQKLDFRYNKISKLEGLKNSRTLTTLNLSNNQISKLEGLENLSALQELNLSSNQINDLSGVENLNELTALNLLDFQDNGIVSIEPLVPLLKKGGNVWRVALKEDYDVRYSEINVAINHLSSPPIEIVQQGNEAILNYFAELEKQGTDYLYEAKMLIVGQPRAGKTSLRCKLLKSEAELPAEEQTTRGIDIERLEFEVIDKEGKPRKFYYNVWDFGGQQIYHSTHQFFLTHRSLYALVIDTGKDSIGNDDTTVNYWLQAVELLGGNSPLLLIKNEKNERQINIDLAQKRGRFRFLKEDYDIDLNALIPGKATFKQSQLDKFFRLKKDIEHQLENLELVGLPMPRNWVQIRNDLKELSSKNPYINFYQYAEICNKHEVTDFGRQMELSRIFHDLGVFLHFQDYAVLKDLIVLQNTWATGAVYAVLEDPAVTAAKGHFTDKELPQIWGNKGYQAIVHHSLLALMMQFELCYQVDKAQPSVYIVPEMLSDKAPAGYEWTPGNDLPLLYRYDFMPKGILTRLIVRLHKHIAVHNSQQVVWKTGAKLNGAGLDCPNTTAEIIEAWDNKQLNIKVKGYHAKDLMSKISFVVDELNNEYFKNVSKDDQSKKVVGIK